MSFLSDNASGAAPEILAAVAAAGGGTAQPYGADALSADLDRRFAEVFGAEVAVFCVATGTAANALALATVAPPWGAIYCHRQAHVLVDECGAPELSTGGARLVPLDGVHGKLHAGALEEALITAGRGDVHRPQPAAVTISQASEAGTVYGPHEIADIAAVARSHGLRVHMDGARLANAVVGCGCDVGDITWRAGVDVLSLGATKNGALGAEAVVFFDRDLARDAGFRRKRAGHLVSKMRFIAAQWHAWFADDLWLGLAGHANAMARRLADGLEGLDGVTVHGPVDANMVFVTVPEPVAAALARDGYGFYRWTGGRRPTLRLVASFDTAPDRVDGFLARIRCHIAQWTAASGDGSGL